MYFEGTKKRIDVLPPRLHEKERITLCSPLYSADTTASNRSIYKSELPYFSTPPYFGLTLTKYASKEIGEGKFFSKINSGRRSLSALS